MADPPSYGEERRRIQSVPRGRALADNVDARRGVAVWSRASCSARQGAARCRAACAASARVGRAILADLMGLARRPPVVCPSCRLFFSLICRSRCSPFLSGVDQHAPGGNANHRIGHGSCRPSATLQDAGPAVRRVQSLLSVALEVADPRWRCCRCGFFEYRRPAGRQISRARPDARAMSALRGDVGRLTDVLFGASATRLVRGPLVASARPRSAPEARHAALVARRLGLRLSRLRPIFVARGCP